MTRIYGIFDLDDSCYYIGQSANTDRRFKEHREAICKGIHSVKALNKVNIDDVDMRVIAEIKCDNSLLIMLTEALYNSIYRPKNKIVWRAGRNCVSFKRIDSDLAKKILKVIEDDVQEV